MPCGAALPGRVKSAQSAVATMHRRQEYFGPEDRRALVNMIVALAVLTAGDIAAVALKAPNEWRPLAWVACVVEFLEEYLYFIGSAFANVLLSMEKHAVLVVAADGAYVCPPPPYVDPPDLSRLLWPSDGTDRDGLGGLSRTVLDACRALNAPLSVILHFVLGLSHILSSGTVRTDPSECWSATRPSLRALDRLAVLVVAVPLLALLVSLVDAWFYGGDKAVPQRAEADSATTLLPPADTVSDTRPPNVRPGRYRGRNGLLVPQ